LLVQLARQTAHQAREPVEHLPHGRHARLHDPGLEVPGEPRDLNSDIVDGGIASLRGELVETAARGHQLADQVHQLVQTPHVHPDVPALLRHGLAWSAHPSPRCPGRRGARGPGAAPPAHRRGAPSRRPLAARRSRGAPAAAAVLPSVDVDGPAISRAPRATSATPPAPSGSSPPPPTASSTALSSASGARKSSSSRSSLAG